MPGFAIGMAASTLAGQYLGAGNIEMAKKSVRFCWVVAVVTMGSAGILISVFNMEFLSLFGNIAKEQLDMAAPVIRVVGLFQVLNATIMVMKMAMRGAGATRIVTLYSFGSMFAFRVGLLWAAMYWLNVDLLGAWLVMMVDVVVQSIIFVRLHFKGDWLKMEV
jgi:Na+-driven multidrug efflux pump